MNGKTILIGIAIGLAILIAVSGAATAETEDQEESVGDLDPTRPVFFNVREEFYKLNGDAWSNALILRTDIVKLGGLRNFIARFDMPVIAADLGNGRDSGLGDLYGQLLLVPYQKDNFSLGIGSGLTIPTASHDTLGGGKWIVSPVVVPTWRFQDRRVLSFVKVQDYISFAGQEDRADIHYLTVTPLLAMKLSERWWVGADTEAKVNWARDNQRSYKSGVVLLRMWAKGFGTWIKPEIPWGPNREGDFTIKCSFFWNY
jgi:hypothetical protein